MAKDVSADESISWRILAFGAAYCMASEDRPNHYRTWYLSLELHRAASSIANSMDDSLTAAVVVRLPSSSFLGSWEEQLDVAYPLL